MPDTANAAAERLSALGPDPMHPLPFRLRKVRRELSDTFTLELDPVGGRKAFNFQPGQFNMLYVFGVGEVPISISGDPEDKGPLVHTIRAVGSVTDVMMNLKPGDVVGVRGPFGRPWPMETAEGYDVVLVTGGVGLAPLRPAIHHLLHHRHKYGNVCIFYGARTPEDILFRKELEEWRARFDTVVDVTVDRATGDWAGRVGVVTKLITRGGYDPHNTKAFVCGPEVMMRYSVKTLMERGLAADDIFVSMERNMKCAVGFCGHCQFGGAFVCKDGPVFPYADIRDIFEVWEL